MPPKPVSSQPMARTLSGFFSKNEPSPATTSTNQEKETEPIPEQNAEKPKRKRASRAKKQESDEKSADAPPSPSKSKSKSKTGTKASSKQPIESDTEGVVERMIHVAIPVRSPQFSKSKTPVPEDTTTSSFQSPNMDATGLSSLTVAPPTEAKRAPPSPSKSTPVSTSVVSNSAATSTPSGASKINKQDAAGMFKIRGGKVSFTEQKLKYYSHPATVTDLAKFHAYREQLQESANPLFHPGVRVDGTYIEITTIPKDHFGLFAKLVEESDQPLSDLANGLMSTLCPLGFESYIECSASLDVSSAGVNGVDHESNMDVDVDVDVVSVNDDDTSKRKAAPTQRGATRVSLTAVMDAIQSVAQRVNYGVAISNLPNAVPVTPANLSVFRWQVQDVDQYFPTDMKVAVTQRRNKRMEASAALTAWFLGLDAKQQDDLCPPVKTRSLSLDISQPYSQQMALVDGMDVDLRTGVVITGNKDDGSGGLVAVEAVVDPAVLEAKLKEAEAKKKEAEMKEEKRLDKERKLAERQAEKEQKEAERLQKEEAKKQKAEEERLKKEQTSLRFVGFFKPASTPVSKKEGSSEQVKNDQANVIQSELFHPFHVKKYTTLAPINSFSTDFSKESLDEELGLGDDQSARGSDMDMDMDLDTVPQLGTMNIKSMLPTLFPNMGKRKDISGRKSRLPPQTKHMSVPEVIQSGLLLQEQDEDLSYLLTWRDIPCLRMRLFQFVENYRPAYYGTWSKRSKKITGRRFLGKDTTMLDYEVDSEAEWEEDEEGEECKTDDEEEDAEEVGTDQDEEDDWLVPEGYLSEDEGLDAGEDGVSKDHTAAKKSKDSRRPNTTHVAPVIVGPIWESTLGEYSCHPALEAYHMEFLGDFEVGMDMFHTTATVHLAGIQV
ncbi:hypothetical protein BGZ83_011773 [Gryganskiella cystojenkinii]|nr:hypothetical protein BGZ83_011773 [Gryganskiella cystojenkinii]